MRESRHDFCAGFDGFQESNIFKVANNVALQDPNLLDMFLIHEDTDCIVISEKIYKHLTSKGYTDIYFEELEQI